MKKILIVITLLLFVLNTEAQQVENSYFYTFNTQYYNPAYVGVRNSVNVVAVSRWQHVKTEGRPASQYASFNMPIFKRKLGIGAHFNRDVIGVREKTLIKLDVSSSTKLGKKTRLNVGISPGLVNYNASFSELMKIDQNDLVANSQYNVNLLDVGVGVYLHTEKAYIGLSMPNVASKKGQVYTPSNHFFFTAGRVFELNPLVSLKPTALIKYAIGAPPSVDLNLSFIYDKNFWISGMFRPGDAFGFSVNHVSNKRYTLGYAFEHTYTFGRSMNTHEFMIMFDLKRNNDVKIYSPRYF